MSITFVITQVEKLSSVTDFCRGLPSCSCFLCCDWLWLAAGSESGRSSPYYGQEGRSSTPTTIQPPKHFHVPGRTSHLMDFYTPWGRFHQPLFTNTNHTEESFWVPWEWRCVKMWLSRIFIPHIIALVYLSTYTAPLPYFTFLYNHPYLTPSPPPSQH